MLVEGAAADDIVLQIQEGQAGIDAAVEIRVDLKGQNPIAAAGVQKGVNLVAVDYIEVAGAQIMPLLVDKKCQRSFQNQTDFQIVVTVGAPGGHLHQKNLQKIHPCVLYDFKFALTFHFSNPFRVFSRCLLRKNTLPLSREDIFFYYSIISQQWTEKIARLSFFCPALLLYIKYQKTDTFPDQGRRKKAGYDKNVKIQIFSGTMECTFGSRLLRAGGAGGDPFL